MTGLMVPLEDRRGLRKLADSEATPRGPRSGSPLKRVGSRNAQLFQPGASGESS